MEYLSRPETDVSSARWLANVTYKSREGRRGVCYFFSRPEELGDVIEAAQERDRILAVEIRPIEDSR